MKKTVKLSDVPHGAVFEYDGVRFVKLDGAFGLTFALTEDVVLKNVPFEGEDAGREDHNNLNGSFIEKKLVQWLVDEHPDLYKATVERPIDLTTMDGMPDYGAPLALIRPLTIDEYRKYRAYIPLASKAYWLATGYSTLRSPNSNAYGAYGVDTDGSLNYDGVYRAYFAARPAFNLKSSIVVSIETEDQEMGLSGYSDTELLDELCRRRMKEQG